MKPKPHRNHRGGVINDSPLSPWGSGVEGEGWPARLSTRTPTERCSTAPHPSPLSLGETEYGSLVYATT